MRLEHTQGDLISNIGQTLCCIQTQVTHLQYESGKKPVEGRCGLCSCRNFHVVLNKIRSKDHCPAKFMATQAKSRAVWDVFMLAWEDDHSINKAAVLKAAIASCA